MSKILATIAQRLGLGVLTLFVVSLVIAGMLELLPGDFCETILGQSATVETVNACRKENGFDQPFVFRYADWLSGFATLDMGKSLANKRDIAELISVRLSNTLFLAGFTAAIAVPLALFLGVLAALYRYSLYDRFVNVFTLTSISFPEFFVAYILVLLLSVMTVGENPIGPNGPWFPAMASVSEDTSFGERLYLVFLPALTLTLVVVAHMMRMTRAAIINLLASPYRNGAAEGHQELPDHRQTRAAQCAGADYQCHRDQPRLSDRRGRGGGGRLQLSGIGQDLRGPCEVPRRAGRSGQRDDFCRDIHPFESDRGYPVHRDQSASDASALTGGTRP